MTTASAPAVTPRDADDRTTVVLEAPGRLHLGFLDPAGTLGRRFGSIGLVVEGYETRVGIGNADASHVSAAGPAEQAEIERAAEHLDTMQRRTGRREPLHLRLLEVLPAHAGFGSGTQLALAVGRAFAQWHRLDVSTPTLANWLGRGARSGIGIAGFDQGGLLVDGGPGPDGSPAPMLARATVPAGWRVIVVQDSAGHGLSGAAERDAIALLPPLAQALSAEICHQVLMRVLPGIASAEFAPFAAGVGHVQQVLGRHFAPAQGGSAFTSAAVGRLVEWIEQHGPAPAATGQSSWGPTGFAIVESEADANAIVDAARVARVVGPSIAMRIVAGRNAGAVVTDARPVSGMR
ncbi:MAG: beta-ribofuranosylaminobenzene 5'-phosphate synthase family protein [Caldimonas sp.]